ncbi:MAG: hypothetical protein KAG26_04490 [Methylococcales bacterium]|nr:hypothetical protein [Methylococcales bacterium]
MIIKKILLCFLLILMLSTISYAEVYKCIENEKTTYQQKPCPEKNDKPPQPLVFGFDGWEFGMQIVDIKKRAKNRQLAMSAGASNFLSSYNEKILNSQPHKRTYTYKTKIMDKLTSVTLFFTKISKKLYKINVTFYVLSLQLEERKYFYESLYAHLSEKYGQPKAIKKSVSNNLLVDFLLKDYPLIDSLIVWKKDKSNIVSMNYNKRYSSKTFYKLIYHNIPLTLKNDREITFELRKRTNNSILKDAKKL